MRIAVGVEIDAIRFRLTHIGGEVLLSNVGPGISTRLDLDDVCFGVNVLARLPLDAIPDLPNGRWFPYIELGGGGQRRSIEFAG